MASYINLYDAAGIPILDKQIQIALIIKANTIAKLTTPTAAQKAFAIAALRNPTDYLITVRNYIFAEYNTQSIAILSSATDSQVQTAVNAAVDTLLGV